MEFLGEEHLASAATKMDFPLDKGFYPWTRGFNPLKFKRLKPLV